MSREKNIYFARLAEQAERYDDMIYYMKEVVKVSALFLLTSIGRTTFQ
jgi:hypothetical protein